MGSLTLGQVREAGRFAFVGGGPLPDWWYVPPDEFVRARVSPESGRIVAFGDAPSDGWRHIRPCDCELCA